MLQNAKYAHVMYTIKMGIKLISRIFRPNIRMMALRKLGFCFFLFFLPLFSLSHSVSRRLVTCAHCSSGITWYMSSRFSGRLAPNAIRGDIQLCNAWFAKLSDPTTKNSFFFFNYLPLKNFRYEIGIQIWTRLKRLPIRFVVHFRFVFLLYKKKTKLCDY